MLVTSFLFQKSHCIFFLLVFIALSNASSSSLRVKYEAFRSKYLGIEMKIFKMKSVWCGSISSKLSMMLSNILVFPLSAVGQIPDPEGDPRNCHWLGSGIERGENWESCFWKSLRLWSSLLLVWLTMSSSYLDIPIYRPIKDSPFMMVATFLSTSRDLNQYIHHQGTKRLDQVFVILLSLSVKNI